MANCKLSFPPRLLDHYTSKLPNTSGDTSNVRLKTTSDGNIVLAWLQKDGVATQVFNPSNSGSWQAQELLTASNASSLALNVGNDGRYAIVWKDSSNSLNFREKTSSTSSWLSTESVTGTPIGAYSFTYGNNNLPYIALINNGVISLYQKDSGAWKEITVDGSNVMAAPSIVNSLNGLVLTWNNTWSSFGTLYSAQFVPNSSSTTKPQVVYSLLGSASILKSDNKGNVFVIFDRYHTFTASSINSGLTWTLQDKPFGFNGSATRNTNGHNFSIATNNNNQTVATTQDGNTVVMLVSQ
jgi:hypothetical protein